MVGILGAGIPMFFIFRNSSREEEQGLEQARRRAGSARIVIDGITVQLDPLSPDSKFGCALLTESSFIYVGRSGGEISIPREAITKVVIARPSFGSSEGSDTIHMSHTTGKGDSEILRISVDDGKQWLDALQSEA